MEGDPVDIHTGIFEELHRLRVVADLHADVGKDAISLGLDQRKTLFAQQLVWGDLTADEGWRMRLRALAGSCRHPS